jgi:hypothetical protein
MERRENRERNERKEQIQQLKQQFGGDPDKLRCVEILEIENDLGDKIEDKMYKLLHDEVSDDLYAGAFKDYKPDPQKFAECVNNYGYRPDIFDDKVSKFVLKMSQDPELAFLRNHGVRKEAELRHLKNSTRGQIEETET